MASNILNWLDLKKPVIADHADTIVAGGETMALADFAVSFSEANAG